MPHTADRRQWVWLLVLAAALLGAATAPAGLPHLYLTYEGDTATAITVNVQTAQQADLRVYYDTVRRDGDRAAYARHATAQAHQIPGLTDGRWVHWIRLSELQPDTVYYFCVSLGADAALPEASFRTLPADGSALRIVTGGDMGADAETEALLDRAAAFGPAVALVGGDIAYANGVLAKVGVWDAWFDRWEKHMRTPAGQLIPMILAIGNHEVRGGWKRPTEDAPFYYGFFAQSGQIGYFSRRLGANASILVLDSDHTSPYGGEQATFVDRALAAVQEQPWRFAIYHVPLYPSVRPYYGDATHADRAEHQAHVHWLPLFDRHRLTAAFENHDHALKRTHPLRAGSVVADGQGTVYLGDGCWGQKRRDSSDRWYLAQHASVHHIWVVDIAADQVRYRAVDAAGKVHDDYTSQRPAVPEGQP